MVDSVGHMGFASNDLGGLLGQVGDHFAGDPRSDKLIESGSVERQRIHVDGNENWTIEKSSV